MGAYMKSYFFNYGNEFIHKIKTDLHISKTNLCLAKRRCGSGINQELGNNIYSIIIPLNKR